MLIDLQRSLLLIVDMQERLLPALSGGGVALARAAFLIRAAKEMGSPILVSEHYASGIGRTSQMLVDVLPAECFMQKIHFSCLAEPDCSLRIAEAQRKQILICGTETHVCVQQTALDLNDAGYETFVVADATASRHQEDKHLALERMRCAGVIIVSAEMVVFEWMRQGDIPRFREVLALIKER